MYSAETVFFPYIFMCNGKDSLTTSLRLNNVRVAMRCRGGPRALWRLRARSWAPLVPAVLPAETRTRIRQPGMEMLPGGAASPAFLGQVRVEISLVTIQVRPNASWTGRPQHLPSAYWMDSQFEPAGGQQSNLHLFCLEILFRFSASTTRVRACVYTTTGATTRSLRPCRD